MLARIMVYIAAGCSLSVILLMWYIILLVLFT